MEFVALFSNITWISILLFVIGMILVIIELYIPGVSIPGILGALTLIACIFVTGQNTVQRLILAGILILINGIILTIFFTLLSKKRLPKSLILEESEENYLGVEDPLVPLGKIGIVLSTCRPAGNADFDGIKADVVSRGEFIEKDAKIEVIEIEGNRIVVKEITEL